MGSPLGRTLHSGCPKSWKILGIRMLASVVLTASGLLLASNVNASPQLFGPSPSIPSRTSAVSAPRRQNEAAIVGSGISALQPTIAEAVAAALAATSSRPSPSSSSSTSGASSGFIPARDSDATPAKYNYIYKVADDGTQTYISQEEQRDGLEVQGTYSYVDPTGAIVTVNYNAGVNGYEEQARGSCQDCPTACSAHSDLLKRPQHTGHHCSGVGRPQTNNPDDCQPVCLAWIIPVSFSRVLSTNISKAQT